MAIETSQPLVYVLRNGGFVDNPEEPVQAPWLLDALYFSFGFAQCGAIQFDAAVMLESPFVDEDGGTPVELPQGADPPFPAVYPILFSSGEIYARDHLNANITMVRGDNFIFRARILDNGEALDVSACTFTMTAKWSVKNANVDAVFTRTLGDGITILDGPNGLIQVELIPANTDGLPDNTVFLPYDIQMIDGDNRIFTPLRGKLKVIPDVTEN